MASRRIPASEWERHKQTIITLYLEKPLKDVIAEMEMEHGFKASENQFQNQLNHVWGFRKNTKRTEWEAFFEESGSMHLATTPAGRQKSKASFKRAKRYLKQFQGTLPTQGLLSQHQPIHASPKSPHAVGNFLSGGSFSPTLGSQFDLGDTFASLGTMLSSSGVNLTSQVVPRSPLIMDPYDYSLGDDTFGFDIDQTFYGNSDSQLIGTRASTNPLCHIPLGLGFQGYDGSLDVTHLDSPSGYLGIRLPVPSNVLSSSRFAELEEYLYSTGIKFTRHGSAEPAGNDPSPSAGFALRFFSNVISSREQSLTRQTSDLECAFQRLGTLIPGESTAIITQDQAFETKFIRVLLFSLLNGFAGLGDIPIESMLKFLGRVQIVSRSLLMIIKDGPTHASRTFLDNIFRAAIEAKDERVLKQILEYKLVDINDTVCFFGAERYTPVERAASLRAFDLVRILVEFGADVNKNHAKDEGGGALNRLVTGILNEHCYYHCHSFNEPYSNYTPTPEMTKTVLLLTKAGTRVTLDDLTTVAQSFTCYEIACDLSCHIPPSHHQAFFQNNEKGYPRERSPIEKVAQYTDDHSATKIISNMVNLCERNGCGKCLTSCAQIVELAATEGAKRGLLKVVQLLIDHVPSPTRIFSAAIRSKRGDLIDFVLSHNPELDPAALSLDYEYNPDNSVRTTPLAEAVRAGNKDLINRLHAAGALDDLSQGHRFEPLVLAAARSGDMSYMQMLLSRADNSYRPYRPPGVSVHLALQNGHEDVAWLLLENGATVYHGYRGISNLQGNATKEDSEWLAYSRTNPLYVALEFQNIPFMRAILSSDVSVANNDDFGAAVKGEDTSIISDLIFSCPTMRIYGDSLRLVCKRSMEEENVNIFRALLESIQPFQEIMLLRDCLQDAVEEDHTEMVRYLLDIGVNPFDKEVLKSALPDHPKMLQLLFDKGRERQAVPQCIGAYAMKRIMAESSGDPKVLDALLETQAVNFIALENTYDVTDNNTDGIENGCLTPLGLALVSLPKYRETNPWMVKRLLQAGANPDRVAQTTSSYMENDSVTNYTGFMLAIESARQDVVQLLIEHGADINKKPHFTIKRTPLQYAAELGNLNIVQMLLDRGADVNGEPALRSGGTALQFAAGSGNCNIAAALLDRGALLDALPSKVNGRWPLEAAAEHGRFDMIQFLWNVKEQLVGNVAGFERRHYLRAMNFARENGHMGCRDLISDLSGVPVDCLDVEDYGAPWLAYHGPDRMLRKLFRPEPSSLTVSNGYRTIEGSGNRIRL